MIKKIIKWWRVKSVRREVIRQCEREAIKNDFECELNKMPAIDLEKGVGEIKAHMRDLDREATEIEKQADEIANDESMEPKLRYDKAKELKDQAREKRLGIQDQEKLIEQYHAAIQQFKKISAERNKLASSLRVKAEFVRTTY